MKEHEGKRERAKFHFMLGSCLSKLNKVIMKINIICMHALEQNDVATFLQVFLPNGGHVLASKTASDT